MIFFDLTKTGAAGHRSGLVRVSHRLLAALSALPAPVQPVSWPLPTAPGAADWFFTAELFSESERPGLTRFIQAHACRLGAIFHDAIPLKHPHITWPRSVERHPGYMKLLAEFDRVWAVSQASKEELEGFWRWQRVSPRARVDVLPLGADLDAQPRVTGRVMPSGVAKLLCVGILEPRKNQAFLVQVCEQLWREGVEFELHVIGRVNPHFGRPVEARMREVAKRKRGRLHYHAAANDQQLLALFADARATVFPTIAEGCGLPLLESLWQGVPCVCSDLPVLRENADGGGCEAVAVNDAAAWAAALRRVIGDGAYAARLTQEAQARALPTWREAADRVMAGLRATP